MRVQSTDDLILNGLDSHNHQHFAFAFAAQEDSSDSITAQHCVCTASALHKEEICETVRQSCPSSPCTHSVTFCLPCAPVFGPQPVRTILPCCSLPPLYIPVLMLPLMSKTVTTLRIVTVYAVCTPLCPHHPRPHVFLPFSHFVLTIPDDPTNYVRICNRTPPSHAHANAPAPQCLLLFRLLHRCPINILPCTWHMSACMTNDELMWTEVVDGCVLITLKFTSCWHKHGTPMPQCMGLSES